MHCMLQSAVGLHFDLPLRNDYLMFSLIVELDENCSYYSPQSLSIKCMREILTMWQVSGKWSPKCGRLPQDAGDLLGMCETL